MDIIIFSREDDFRFVYVVFCNIITSVRDKRIIIIPIERARGREGRKEIRFFLVLSFTLHMRRCTPNRMKIKVPSRCLTGLNGIPIWSDNIVLLEYDVCVCVCTNDFSVEICLVLHQREREKKIEYNRNLWYNKNTEQKADSRRRTNYRHVKRTRRCDSGKSYRRRLLLL